ncbi:MAG: hypothetical protein KA310_03240 [Pseudomonadales bacterium]|nr:hypothetical protein [Pseudomonadales bacterium]
MTSKSQRKLTNAAVAAALKPEHAPMGSLPVAVAEALAAWNATVDAKDAASRRLAHAARLYIEGDLLRTELAGYVCTFAAAEKAADAAFAAYKATYQRQEGVPA